MRIRIVLASLAIAAACSGKKAGTGPGPGSGAGSGSSAAPPGPGSAAGSGSSGTAPLSGAPAVKVTLADVGLEASSLDRTVDPCVDFYQFTCGGWLQNNQIPPDRARWGRAQQIDEKNKAAIKNLLEEAAKGIGADAATKKLGDYYAACMDEGAIEKAGTAALRPLLDKTTNVKDAKTWLAALIELHRVGRWVIWTDHVQADLKEAATNVLYLDAAGLGLPDRDYYVKPELKDKVDLYKAHVAKTLTLAGTPQPKSDAAAADVLAIELELAKLTKTSAEKRDLSAMYNPTDGKGLAKQIKVIDWKAYWKGLDIEPSAKLVVGTPKFFAQIDRIQKKFKWTQWASYFTYHLVDGMAFALPKAFDDQAFELQKALTGADKQKERSRRCIESTQGSLGELLGQKFVEKSFPSTAKATAAKLLDALIDVLHGELGKAEWMTEATRQLAQSKLSRVVKMIGYPDKWRTYDYDVKRDDFGGNVLRAAVFETRRALAKAGKPVDRSEWQMQTYQLNAYYETTANNATLPAGILQPPYFGQDRSVAANLGGIGTVVGHELTHGFDDQGAQFDADGNLKPWWDKEDAKRFADKSTCVAEQYSTFEAMPGGFVNGRLTLNENVADLGGVKLAFAAYRLLRKDAAKAYIADGFTEDQQFFIAVGQVACGRDRPPEIQRRLAGDVRAPPKFRVFGSLRNLTSFSDAFQCAPGTPMHPAKTCSVW